MTSKPGQQTIAEFVLPNASRSKDYQTMQFGQPIEFILRKIFLQKSHTKCGGETMPMPISKKSKFSVTG